MTIYAALPFVRRTGMYSVRLPNLYNVSFDYYYCLIAVMLSYIPCKKICFMCTCMKQYSDKCRVCFGFFCQCFLSSTSTCCGREEGCFTGRSSWRRTTKQAATPRLCLSRPRLHATITSHTRSSSSSSFLEQDKRSFTVSERKHWKHVHRSSAAGAGDGSW